MDERTKRIQELNDQLRTTLQGGRVMMTVGIEALGEETVAHILVQVQAFDAFDADNDPYQEHDFGRIEIGEHVIFFKIDAYDAQLKFGSEDPADPTKTTRVMTIMLAEEY